MKQGLRFFHYASVLLLGAIFVLSTPIFAQQFTVVDITNKAAKSPDHSHSEKCGHGILEAQIEKEMGYFGSKPFFESWIDQKIEARRNTPQILAKTNEGPRLIPVVVHVIHSGQAEGTGVNIPLSQIEAQIRILNEDFRRLNADANRTPAEFLPVAADSNIEFVLAKQDPSGLPTTGIVRVLGTKVTYSPDDATLIGQLSQWNPEEYLNIWVVALTQPYIGYASFPISDLPGLNFAPSSAITDGVTIDYRFFGTGGNAVPSYLGRTSTHEVGHYFGLRHIWGDGGCGVDDFVTDTPNQDSANTVCSPTVTKVSCGNNNMIQNYMDYTPDACMNLFTKGQVERFDVVLANSPRRVTLVNNRATQEPVLADRDLAIFKVIEPGEFACEPTISPSIEVKNAGSTTLTSGRVQLIRNGVVLEDKRFTFNLATGQSAILTFNDFTLLPTENQVEFKITQSNDLPDEKTDNNSKLVSPIIQADIDLPYTLDLTSFPNPWSIDNPDDLLTWARTDLTIAGTIQPAVFIRHYDYEAPGQQDYFISPTIDLNDYPNAQLVFEMAHALYGQDGFQDELVVAISQDCGNTFDLANATYQKIGQTLETSDATLDEFIPTTESQFRTELVNLKKFAGLGRVKIAFITKNGYGNNIFLKNIRILPQEEFKYELVLNELVSPNPIVDGTQAVESVRISNTGNLPVSKFLFTRSTNGLDVETYIASGSEVAPGESFVLSGRNTTSAGKNRLDYKVYQPNFDQNNGDNGSTLRRFIIENTDKIEVPWRQNFNNTTSLGPWITINPQADATAWTVSSVTNGSGQSNVVRLQNQVTGYTYWLGTPIFDMSVSRQGSIFFDLAAGSVSPGTTLKVLASADAGENYTEVWSASGTELSTVSAGEANPNTATDFSRKYVNLTDFAGPGKTETRIAFVVEGGIESDSPIYLDNIELFLSANPEPVIPTEGMAILYPNPATDIFNIAFNLPGYETVTIQVISSTGAVVQEIEYPKTLNQTYSFSTELFSRGLFIIKITSDTIQETRKLIIN
ncbi:MAG: M43 family zinc metalloprotease [Algoriphagus sp.]|nr:M43 family zinc metalloprotease [Algoriphagus sp.]